MIAATSWPCRGRPGVAVCLSGRGRGGRYVAAVAMAPGRRLGRGGRVAFCVAVVWLQHADEC